MQKIVGNTPTEKIGEYAGTGILFTPSFNDIQFTYVPNNQFPVCFSVLEQDA